MGEFQPITLSTQEDVDRFVADRVARAKRTAAEDAAKQYAGFSDYKSKAEMYDVDVKALNDKIAGLEGEKSERDAKIAELEEKLRENETNSVKMRIAREYDIPGLIAVRLKGSTEEEIRADAESLRSELYRRPQAQQPYVNSGGGTDDKTDSNTAALKDMLQTFREN